MYKTPKTEKKEQAAEDTTIKREAETKLEVTLCNKVLEIITSLVETVEDNRVQEATEDPMGPMGELRKDQEPQEEDKCDQTNTLTVK